MLCEVFNCQIGQTREGKGGVQVYTESKILPKEISQMSFFDVSYFLMTVLPIVIIRLRICLFGTYSSSLRGHDFAVFNVNRRQLCKTC